MPKQPTLASALIIGLLVGGLLPGATGAQRPAPPPARPSTPPPLPGTPMTPPPVNHPGLVGQPLFGDTSTARKPGQPRPPRPGGVERRAPVRKIDASVARLKKSGSEVKRAVDRLASLPWHDSLDAATAEAAKSGKPVLWLRTLGDLTGIASRTVQSLRGVTLANEDLLALIESRFVLGRESTAERGLAGITKGYRATNSAVGSTNGAGARHVLIFVLAADGTVLHALPGFWCAQDLIPELQLALEIQRLHVDASMSDKRKLEMFEALHKTHLRRHGKAAESRGPWDPLDSQAELKRAESEARDTFKQVAGGVFELKSIPEVVHDRLVARPFQKLAKFDVATFVDYGRVP